MRLLLVLLFVACTPKPKGPTVLVHFVYPEQWDKPAREYVQKLGSTWYKLGLKWEYTDDPNRTKNPCPHDWPTKKIVDCVIDVALYRKDGMYKEGLAGLSDRATNETWIDSRWVGLYLLAVTAHEIGHQVINTWEHVTSGIMQPASNSWSPSKEDLALACRLIGRGC